MMCRPMHARRIISAGAGALAASAAAVFALATGCGAGGETVHEENKSMEYAVDTFKTPGGGDVEITPLRHASLRIRFNGLEIYVDPVGAKMEPAIDFSAFPKADVILVTHEHFDHFDGDAITELRKEGTRVVVNPRVRGMLGSGTALANGGSLSLGGGVSVDAVPAYNTTPERDRFHPKGRDNGYVISLDGFRIYVAGDTEDIPEMADVRDIDVAFLPCNQPYTMTPEQAAKAALAFRPKVLFPYHYSDTPVAKVAELLAGSGIDVRIRNL